jgi:cobalt-zinc-cadmium efflux system membrane fusion protein
MQGDSQSSRPSSVYSNLVRWLRQPGCGSRVPLAAAGLTIALIAAGIVWLYATDARQPESSNDAVSHQEGAEATPLDYVELDGEAQREIGLVLEPAVLASVSDTLELTGTVAPNEMRVAHIRPLARGQVERVHVRVGDRVRQGDPLVSYDNIELGELISTYRSALAGLGKAQAEAEVTQNSLDRGRKLLDLGTISKSDFEKRGAENQSSQAAIDVYKAEAAMIEQKMRRFGISDADLRKLGDLARQPDESVSHSTLRAPFDGIVIKAEAAEGELVESERELFTLADLSTVWVQGDVYEKDLASVRPGQPVKIAANAYAGESFNGKITYLSDFLDRQTRTAKVRCEVSNPGIRLKLEMFVTIQIPTGSASRAVVIPTAAVQQIDGQSAVFVRLNDTRFQKRNVQIGSGSEGWVRVLGGLVPGEIIVTQGAFMLKSQLRKHEFGEGEH